MSTPTPAEIRQAAWVVFQLNRAMGFGLRSAMYGRLSPSEMRREADVIEEKR